MYNNSRYNSRYNKYLLLVLSRYTIRYNIVQNRRYKIVGTTETGLGNIA